jgi:adenosylcobyric acid synthase
MAARVLMIQGTSSSVGKSLLVTALCRIFARQGLRVAPFKAQNMSNNAAVCADGAEIGRSQAVQAAAAGIMPCADMNPILLKPEGQGRTQIIAMGQHHRTVSARAYAAYKDELWPLVTAALDRLRATYDVVLIEGAGSPVELNLRSRDLVNMAVARYAQAPVVLVGDIARGGIFAQLLGTLWLFPPEEQALVRGLVINQFHGDVEFFADGVRLLEERSARPVLGVMPFLPDLRLPEEDAADLDTVTSSRSPGQGEVDIAVIRLPHIANFDDFGALAAEPGVTVRYVTSPALLGQPQAVILPGTKSTIDDLRWLRAQGLEPALQRLTATGTVVVGICGGYQMLGQRIDDPEGIESPLPTITGLGFLPVTTVFETTKATYQAEACITGGPGWLAALQGQRIYGYEIHMGRTPSPQPWLTITQRNGTPTALAEGLVVADGHIWGCYLHGLFDNGTLRRAWLRSLGWQPRGTPDTLLPLQTMLDRLAVHVETHLDMTRLEMLLGVTP